MVLAENLGGCVDAPRSVVTRRSTLLSMTQGIPVPFRCQVAGTELRSLQAFPESSSTDFEALRLPPSHRRRDANGSQSQGRSFLAFVQHPMLSNLDSVVTVSNFLY